METVTQKPPQFIALHWDGSDKTDFSDNLEGVSVLTDGESLVLLKGGQVMTVPKGSWLVVASLSADINSGIVVTDSDFSNAYQVVTE